MPALESVIAGASQGDPLVQQAAGTDFGGFADHHPHAVVDEHAVADAGAGMDFNAGQGTADLAEAAGRQLQRQMAGPEPVADPMQKRCLHCGVWSSNSGSASRLEVNKTWLFESLMM